MGEAFCVTTCLLALAVLWHFMTRNLTSVVATSLVPFLIDLEDAIKLIYFLLAALVAVIMGAGVGFLANRRTMVTSLTIANVCIAIGVQVLSLHYIYTNLPEAVFFGLGWKYVVAFVIPNLFRSLTVAVTEVAVALYVARKFRKNV